MRKSISFIVLGGALLLASPPVFSGPDDEILADQSKCSAPSIPNRIEKTADDVANINEASEIQEAKLPRLRPPASKYQTAPMLREYDPKSDRANGIPYYTPKEREKFRVYFKDGKLYQQRFWGLSKLKNSPEASPPYHAGFLFVMDGQGNSLCRPRKRCQTSFFLSGWAPGRRGGNPIYQRR